MPGFTFYIEELRVFFPYDAVYPEQLEYMKELKRTLDTPGHCILEMPTGTGKTVALFSLITAYQLEHPNIGKLVFCTRTIQEMDKALEELRTIINYRDDVLLREGKESSKVLGVGLSARRNMCVNPDVANDTERDRVDAKCRRLIAPYQVQARAAASGNFGGVVESGACKCVYYERYQTAVQDGELFVEDDIYSISELTQMGKREDLASGVVDIEDVLKRVVGKPAVRGRRKERLAAGAGVDAGAAPGGGIEQAGGSSGSRAAAPGARAGVSSAPFDGGGLMEDDLEGDFFGGISSGRGVAASSAKTAKRSGHQKDHEEQDHLLKTFGTLPDGITSADGVDIDAAVKYGGWCPYYTARRLVAHAKVVVLNYQYVLDPKVSAVAGLGGVGEKLAYASQQFGRKLASGEKEPSILVFDEAHNIDDICMEALSVNLDNDILKTAERNVEMMKSEITRVKHEDCTKLQDEYRRLVQGLHEQGRLNDVLADRMAGSPVAIPEDIQNEAVPGNIRKGEAFLDIIKKMCEFLREYLNVDRASTDQPLSLLQKIQDKLEIEGRTLKFFYERLKSLMNTLSIADYEKFAMLSRVCDFCTLLGTYSQGFTIIIDPNPESINVRDPELRLYCVDASIAMKPVQKRYQSIILTSGTISPMSMYVDLLGLTENMVSCKSFRMTMTRKCICPLIVTRGADQTPVSSNFEARDNESVTRNYGDLILNLARTVPDGMVCFFTSYRYMELVMQRWYESGVLGQLMDEKLVFLETKDIIATQIALRLYREACDSGRGAIFLSIARGKVAEGIDFDQHYGRCVVLFGVPFQYTLSYELRARLHYLNEHYGIEEAEFLNFDAMRHASQCVGRVLRSKKDYGVMVFADVRYGKSGKREKIPEWIQACLDTDNTNLATDSAVLEARRFLLQMSQPYDLKKAAEGLLGRGKLPQEAHGAKAERAKKMAELEAAELEAEAAEAAAGDSGEAVGLTVGGAVGMPPTGPPTVGVGEAGGVKVKLEGGEEGGKRAETGPGGNAKRQKIVDKQVGPWM